MIKYKDALNLLYKYELSDTVINHSKLVSVVAEEIGEKIGLEEKKIILLKIASLLHDIGKSKNGLHELNTIEILKDEGLYQIADISLHGFVYEYFKLEYNIECKNFLPGTLLQKILVIADMYVDQEPKQVSIEERFNDILQRYSNNKKFIEVVKLAYPRIQVLEKEIINLYK